MPTVREVTYDLFREHGMTTMFGNPGSTELPMLTEFPDDFDYVLGLQEAAVVGMADGHAQVTGKPTLVNLHTAPGLGNAMGGLFNAQANHSPLVITVGQQVRAQVTMQANLTNRDATRVPHPFVKFSYEPARAEDVPLALAPALFAAALFGGEAALAVTGYLFAHALFLDSGPLARRLALIATGRFDQSDASRKMGRLRLSVGT